MHCCVKCLHAGVLVWLLLSVQASAQDVPVVETNTRANTEHAQPSFAPELPAPPLPHGLPEGLPIPPMADSPFGPLHGKLVEPIIDVIEFRGLTLNQALRLLSEQTGMRVVASEKAGEKVISAYLKLVSPLSALGAIARANGLFIRSDPQSHILTVYTQEEYEADLTSFREEQTKVFTLLYPNAYDVGIAIRDLYGAKVLLSFGDNDTTLLTDLAARFTRFDIVDARSQGTLFGGGIGGFGGIGGGIGGIGGIGGGIGGIGGIGTGIGGIGGIGTGIGGVGGIGTGIGGIGTGIGGIGTGIGGIGTGIGGVGGGGFGGQGSTAQTGPSTDGITIFITVIRRHNQVVVRTSDPKTMRQICDLVAHLDVPTPLVLLEVKILRVRLDDEFKSAFDWQLSDGGLAGSFTRGDIVAPQPNVPQQLPITIPGTGFDPQSLLFQYVTSNFRARMELLETKNRITEVATPMLLTANNEVSKLFIGTQQPITVGFTAGTVVTTGLATATTVTPTPQTVYQSIGTQLLITPNINADRTVTLRISQQTSSIVPNGGTIPLPNPVTGAINNVLVDTIRQQTFSGTVVAKDGHALAIGGLIEERLQDVRRQIPVLGRLPYLGFFFRSQITDRIREELVVVVRPFVFYTPVESAAMTHDMLRKLSHHPLSPHAAGNMEVFAPEETLWPNPPRTPLERIFQVHMISPKDF